MPLIFKRRQRGKTSNVWSTKVGKKILTTGQTDATLARREAQRLRAEATIAAVEAEAAELAADAVNHQDEGAPRPPLNVPGTNGPGTAAGAQSGAGGGHLEVGKTDLQADQVDQAEGKTTGDPAGTTTSAGAAADINAAAAGVAGAAPDDDQVDDDEEPDPDIEAFLADIVGDAGQVAVEVQIRIQQWAWRRYRNVQVGDVPPNHPAREKGARLWGKFFRRILPDKIPIPMWAQELVGAIVVVAMKTTPVQLAGARQAGAQAPAGHAYPVDVDAREAA